MAEEHPRSSGENYKPKDLREQYMPAGKIKVRRRSRLLTYLGLGGAGAVALTWAFFGLGDYPCETRTGSEYRQAVPEYFNSKRDGKGGVVGWDPLTCRITGAKAYGTEGDSGFYCHNPNNFVMESTLLVYSCKSKPTQESIED